MNELVIVSPMKSRTGGIQYIQFTAGSSKGGITDGTLFNDVFKLGEMNDNRVNYTAASVTESATVTSAQATAHNITVAPVWTPFKSIEAVQIVSANSTVTTYSIVDAGSEVADTSCSVSEKTITFNSADTKFVADASVKFGYLYDNVKIPQNDIPQLTARMDYIPLEAKARRIGVYYSQMASFQAKTEMGIDLGEVLASQACGELSYKQLLVA